MVSFALFDTAIGVCAIAWRGEKIAGGGLPEGDAARTRARMAKRGWREEPPPAFVKQAINGVQALMRGERLDLREIKLDMSGLPEFDIRVYEAARRIRPGETTTYGALARTIGEPDAARAVGQALGRNPFAPIVPCHRVMAAGGKTGGFSAHGGVSTKLRMLAIEGAEQQASLFD